MQSKKINKCLSVCLLIMTFVISGCSCEFWGSTYKKFNVDYTANLELLVGEDWKDELVKGNAIKKDG